jgi:uncharacterized protein with GYD domain
MLEVKSNPIRGRGGEMANYIVLAKLTAEGAKGLKDAPQRLAQVSGILAAEGAKITAAYATLGEYDYVFVVEGPEDTATVAKCVAAVGMMGSVSTQTMPAIPIADFFKVVGEI